MCGLSAYLHFDNSSQENGRVGFPDMGLDESLRLIKHRGPDSRGTYISPDGRCGLGHTRLSIIDLEGGQQPIENETGTVHAVVNGELYDYERITEELKASGHTFKTKSDSEIAVHLYEEQGLSFFDQLRGEFAICIWDSRRKKLIAVRDRFGIKPMYYTVVNGTLLIASEIKAFLPFGWKAEWDISSILHNGVMCDNRTVFRGVHKLPPAHYLTATLTGTVEVGQYWDADYPDKTIPETRSVEEMVQGVREHLVDAVRHRLRADVPLGIYLSGGIDSAAMAGIATHLLQEKDSNAKVHTFSISFKDDLEYDEGPIAERTAAFCGAVFHKLVVSQEDLVNAFDESVWHVEMPLFNMNTVGKFLLSKLVRNSGYKVVLTGEGSDEHFAGYEQFQLDYCLEPDLASPASLKFNEAVRLQKLKEHEGQYLAITKAHEIGDPAATAMINGCAVHNAVGLGFALSERFYHQDLFKIYGRPDPPFAVVDSLNGIARRKAKTKWHPLHTSLYTENHTFLSNYICNALGDRSEMAHSIEARTPFLDHVLCEYVNNLPPSVKIRSTNEGNFIEKWILKEATKPFITDEIYNRTKRPYLAPMSNGKDLPMITLMKEKLTKENVEQLGFISWETLDECKQEFLAKGSPDLYRYLLYVASYVVLSQKFDVQRYGAAELGVAKQ
ncbi:hypothetical protein DFQ28_007436 [Apophysomyces sp. BC1034]|nr:hypothetical protein DFQ30_009745 [Apophysomyces sp. BC1015]KAG0182369.1 hypothetical protein DFQ29_004422 [Apophysomyces sp. BC1021]KAG0192826.1 hypothetical protein DFQ28_007436 [Apophysomyces sp. BC1034]